MEEKASGAFVGRAGHTLSRREDWPGIEIGWALHPDHWGKGYATEAGAASVDWSFAHHDVDALYSVILPENTASQAVAPNDSASRRGKSACSHTSRRCRMSSGDFSAHSVDHGGGL